VNEARKVELLGTVMSGENCCGPLRTKIFFSQMSVVSCFEKKGQLKQTCRTIKTTEKLGTQAADMSEFIYARGGGEKVLSSTKKYLLAFI
jgi:hypothetical protein